MKYFTGSGNRIKSSLEWYLFPLEVKHNLLCTKLHFWEGHFIFLIILSIWELKLASMIIFKALQQKFSGLHFKK